MKDKSDRAHAAGANPRSKRKPPVIDAEAKDVTPPAPAPEPEIELQPEPKSGPKSEPAPEPAPDVEAAYAPKPAGPPVEWRAMLPAIAVAAVCGVGAGLFGSWLFSGAVPPPADTSAISNSIAQLSSRLTQQEAKPQPVADLTPLNERSTKLETATGELRGQVAEVRKLIEAQAKGPSAAELAAVDRRLAQIEDKVGALAALPKPAPRNESQPAEVVALGALRDAVAAGTPFVTELNAVRGMLKDRAAALAPFDKFAKDGLPTVAMLAKRFEPLASRLASAPPPASDSGVFTRLWSNAGKLVEVRPVGEPQGADTGAVVARMETKLARGDLAAALDEAKALPAAAREIAKDWFAAAEQRRDAEAAIKNLINAALAAISAER